MIVFILFFLTSFCIRRERPLFIWLLAKVLKKLWRFFLDMAPKLILKSMFLFSFFFFSFLE